MQLKVIYADSLNKQSYFNMAQVYKIQGNYEQALTAIKNAINIDNGYFKAQLFKGEILEKLGMIEGAVSQYRLCIKSEQYNTYAYWSLANIGADLDMTDIKVMEKLLTECKDDQSRIYLSFSLSYTYENLKNYHSAYQHLELGNKLKRQSIQFQLKPLVRDIECLANSFDPARMN